MTNKLDLLKIRFNKLQERISIYTFVSGMLSTIVLAISAYFVGTFLYGSFDITFDKEVLHFGALIATALGMLTIGTIKKKVNEVGYNFLTFDLGEINKVKSMLEQETPCKDMLEKVDQLTEAERKQYIIDDMSIGEDVDK